MALRREKENDQTMRRIQETCNGVVILWQLLVKDASYSDSDSQTENCTLIAQNILKSLRSAKNPD